LSHQWWIDWHESLRYHADAIVVYLFLFGLEIVFLYIYSNLNNFQFSGNLSNTITSNSNIAYSKLNDADLYNATLTNSSIHRTDLTNAYFRNATLTNATLEYSKLNEDYFRF